MKSLRGLVIIIGLIEVTGAIAIAALLLPATGTIGKVIGQTLVGLMAWPLCLLLLPGLALALANRWLPAALAMVVLAALVTLTLWRLA